METDTFAICTCHTAMLTRPGIHRPATNGGRHAAVSDTRALPAPACNHSTEGLSGRQVQILRFMAQGRAIDGIADELGYSSSTIKKEVRITLQLVGARNRTHAVAMAIRAGII